MHLGNMKSVMNYGVHCPFKKDLLSYRHSELPLGQDLYGDALEAALNAIFDDNSTDIMVKQLAPATNSQRNEAFNNVVESKNPRIRFLPWK